MSDIADRIERELKPHGRCRDCADSNGRCLISNELCDPDARAEELSGEVRKLQQQLDEEIQNKKEFERDWLECCEQLSASQKQVEALWNNCRIIYYYEDESYPLEHNKRARKIMREEIEHELSQLKE